MRSGHVRHKGNLSFLVGCQMHSNDMMTTQGGYRLSLVLHAIHRITDNCFAVVYVQPAFKVLIISMTWHSDIQIAKRLVRHTHILIYSTRHHLGIG